MPTADRRERSPGNSGAYADVPRLVLLLIGGGLLAFAIAALFAPSSGSSSASDLTPGVGMLLIGLVLVAVFVGQALVALGLLLPGEGRFPWVPGPIANDRKRWVLWGLVVIPTIEILLLATGAYSVLAIAFPTILLLPVAWIYVIVDWQSSLFP